MTSALARTRRRTHIASSRTGTGKWRRIRAQAIANAIASNITNCPICGVQLDYEYYKRPNSAEVDHILPYSRGGTDTLTNTQVICRYDNQRKGNGTRKRKAPKPRTVEPATQIPW